MGRYQTASCSDCGASASVGGPEEFFRDEGGVVQVHGHPVAFSEQARRAGVHGLRYWHYCVRCDERFDHIVVEFAEPARDSLAMWIGQVPIRTDWEPAPLVCPTCKRDEHLMRIPEDYPATPEGWPTCTCPFCGGENARWMTVWT